MGLSGLKYYELVGYKEALNSPRAILFLTATYILHGELKFNEQKLVDAIYSNACNTFMQAEKEIVIAGFKGLHLLAHSKMDAGGISESLGLHIDNVLALEHRYHEMIAHGAKETLEHLHLT
jgi:hypothetical protein